MKKTKMGSSVDGSIDIWYTKPEADALERLVKREEQNSTHVPFNKAELIATLETEWLEVVRILQEKVAELEAKEIDGRTERRVSQRRKIKDFEAIVGGKRTEHFKGRRKADLKLERRVRERRKPGRRIQCPDRRQP